MAVRSRTPLYCKKAFAEMDSVTRFCRSKKKKMAILVLKKKDLVVLF